MLESLKEAIYTAALIYKLNVVKHAKARTVLAKCFQLTEREYKNGASKKMI